MFIVIKFKNIKIYYFFIIIYFNKLIYFCVVLCKVLFIKKIDILSFIFIFLLNFFSMKVNTLYVAIFVGLFGFIGIKYLKKNKK